MTGWLLDTNVLSGLRRPGPERKVLAFIAVQPLDLSTSARQRWPKSGLASSSSVTPAVAPG